MRARIANEQKQQDRVPFGLAQGKRDDMFAARRTRQLQSKNVVQAAERRLYLGRHGVCPPHAGATECRLTLMLYEFLFFFLHASEEAAACHSETSVSKMLEACLPQADFKT